LAGSSGTLTKTIKTLVNKTVETRMLVDLLSFFGVDGAHDYCNDYDGEQESAHDFIFYEMYSKSCLIYRHAMGSYLITANAGGPEQIARLCERSQKSAETAPEGRRS